jgi:hypothetical protein
MTVAVPTAPPAIPPGTFRIDREGVWRHEGQEVTHPGVLQNLYVNLHADAGGHFLQIGPTRIPVEVEDTPFVVTRVDPAAAAGAAAPGLRLWLSDGTQEPLTLDSLWLGSGETPYCRVKGGRFTARLAVAAWLQLAAFVEEEPGTGLLSLVVGARRVPIERRV